ncbi:MAG: hypothetical protein JWN46_2358 [Acidimicrobiales bacterium]|nr:hypothetical protein [Acidimicrobiales bacterium]
MNAAWYRYRATLRRRWVAWIAVGVLAGAAVGVVMVAAAGARRTGSSLGRIVAAQHVSDVFIGPQNGAFTPAQIRELSLLPQVKETLYIRGALMTRVLPNGQPDLHFAFDAPGVITLATPLARDFNTPDRPHLLAGRLPAPDTASEILISDAAAAAHHLAVGSRLTLGFFDAQLFNQAVSTGKVPRDQHRFSVTVTGIQVGLDDVTRSADDPRRTPLILLSPALSRAVADLAPPYEGLFVRLRDPRELPSFERGASALVAPTAGGLSIRESENTLQRARRESRPFVLALWLFAALTAFAGAAVIVQTCIRQQRLEAGETGALRAIGFARRELVQHELLRGGFIGVVAAVVAATVAVAGSSLMPVGPLRVLEPHRGVDLDLTVLGLGTLSIVALMIGLHVVAARHESPSRPVAPQRVADAVARRGAPVTVVAGVRFALDRGRGEAAIPLRSTLLGITVAISALVSTIVYGAGLKHFTSTPRLYGWVWDYQLEPGDGSDTQIRDAVPRSRAIVGSAVGYYAQPVIGGKVVPAVAMDPQPGIPLASIVTGRGAQNDHEIVLGRDTLRGLGLHIGEAVDVTITPTRKRFTIVGQAVFARFSPYPASSPTGLGNGAAITAGGLRRFGPLDDPTSLHAPNAGAYFVLVRTRPGTTTRTLEREVLHGDRTAGTVLAQQRPNDLVSYRQLQRTPLLLVGLLAFLALATTAHLLLSTVRSRRRDLAVLRAVGFTRRQLRLSILVQATTLACLALVVAVPLGLVAGRTMWTMTANWLGIPVEQVLPLLTLAGVAAAALVVVNLLALVPSIGASRVRAAESLRTE